VEVVEVEEEEASEVWLASNGEGSLEQAMEGDDGLYVAQLTGVAPVFIGVK
jgi:hypothetical protein